MCGAYVDLVELAFDGNSWAVEQLYDVAFNTNLPMAVRRAWRDQMIKGLARQLQAEPFGIAQTKIAVTLWSAGKAIMEPGHSRMGGREPISRDVMGALDMSDRETFADKVREIAKMNQGEWPGRTAIYELVREALGMASTEKKSKRRRGSDGNGRRIEKRAEQNSNGGV